MATTENTTTARKPAEIVFERQGWTPPLGGETWRAHFAHPERVRAVTPDADGRVRLGRVCVCVGGPHWYTAIIQVGPRKRNSLSTHFETLAEAQKHIRASVAERFYEEA